MRRVFVFIITAGFCASAYAMTQPRDAFELLRTAVERQDSVSVSKQLTGTSQPLYQRFSNYKLLGCLPTDLYYYGAESLSQNSTLLTATLQEPKQKKQLVKLIYTKEKEDWKLDLPATLQRSLGQHWQEHVNTIEQLYLMLRVQAGDRLNCQMLKVLIQPEPAS